MLILPSLVYESTADGFVSENALAGAIPTEIGQLAQLARLDLERNQLTGAPKTHLIAILVYEYTNIYKRPACYAGNIPTEFGRCTAMEFLRLDNNQLTGEHFFAHVSNSLE